MHSTIDIESKVQNRLKDIFNNVNDWLKFAESKNGALIGLNSLVIVSLISWLSSNFWSLYLWVVAYTACVLIFMTLAVIVSLLSFVAITDIQDTVVVEESYPDKPNLLFFGHLAKCKPKDLLLYLYETYGSQPKRLEAFELDYAGQIINNSKITLKKYSHFNLAVQFTLMGVLTPLIAFILFKFLKIGEKNHDKLI